MQKFLTTLVLGAIAFATLTTTSSARDYSRLYFFGDSLTDSGNVFLSTFGNTPPPPYFKGRFSNGPTYADIVAQGILAPALIGGAPNINFAFGGATAAPGAGGIVPDVQQQVGLYFLSGLRPGPNDLFTLFAGGNDILNAIGGPAPGVPSVTNAANRAATSMTGNAKWLISAGAKNLVIPNLPDLGRTPALNNTAAKPLGSIGTELFNTKLKGRLSKLKRQSPSDVNIILFDTEALFKAIVDNPKRYGFRYANASFLQLPVDDPNNYVFWDPIHPTAPMHEIVAGAIMEVIHPEYALGAAASQIDTALFSRELIEDEVSRRLTTLSQDRVAGSVDQWNFFLSANYQNGGRDPVGFNPGFDHDMVAASLGFDRRFSEDLYGGVALHYSYGGSDLNFDAGEFDFHSQSINLYAGYRGWPVYVHATLGGDVIQYKDIERQTMARGFVAESETDGYGLRGAVEVGKDIAAGENFSIRPRAALRYAYHRVAGYEEENAPAMNFAYEDQDADSLSGIAGVAATYFLGGTGSRWILDLSADYRHELLDDSRSVSGKLADNLTRTTTLDVEQGHDNAVVVGAAITAFFAENLSVSLGYAGEIREDEYANRVLLGIQSNF